MYTLLTLISIFVSLASIAISSVRGALYVNDPSTGLICQGGQTCTIEWLDDGTQPLLSSIGLCTVGLFTGDQQLIQQIQPVDVSTAHFLQFTPDPKAGPNSGNYYVAFTSTTAKAPNGTSPYVSFSPSLTLNQMSGSFNTPVPSDTSSIPIPSGTPKSTGDSVTSTATIGKPGSSSVQFPSVTPSHSSSSSSFLPSISGFSTASSPIPSASSTSISHPSPSSSTSGAARRTIPAAILPVLAFGALAVYIA